MVSLQMAKGLDDLKETLNRGKFDGIEKMNHQWVRISLNESNYYSKCQPLSHDLVSKTQVEIDQPLLGVWPFRFFIGTSATSSPSP